jgi:hypothetical protein
MMRFLFWASGLMVGAVALVIMREQQRATRPIPVKQAADLLREAWSDAHTRA